MTEKQEDKEMFETYNAFRKATIEYTNNAVREAKREMIKKFREMHCKYFNDWQDIGEYTYYVVRIDRDLKILIDRLEKELEERK